MRKIFMLIICAAFVNIFSACGAQNSAEKKNYKGGYSRNEHKFFQRKRCIEQRI